MKHGTAKSGVEPLPVPVKTEVGICCTCNYSPDCVYLKAAGQPIWYCDQFDTYVPRREISLLEVLGEAEASAARTVTADPQAGLCSDCGARTDCVNRVPGVKKIFCEGYC
jgi:hypothetical protein